jgi:hypothetical protein
MVSVVDWLPNTVPPSETLTVTVLSPRQVSGEIAYVVEINLYWPPSNEIMGEAITVSSPQLETAETVTVYLFLPLEQFPTLLKTPTLMPAEAVTVLRMGVATTAQPELPVEPPPPPGLPF